MSTPVYPTFDSTGKEIPRPSMPLKETPKPNSIIFVADSGHEERRKKGDTLFMWDIDYPVLTTAMYNTIRDFYITNTDVVSFNWTHPVSKTVYLVRFESQTPFAASQFSHNTKTCLWSLQFRLTQVL
jgi:hypothetical protein